MAGFNKFTCFVIHVECRIKAVEWKYLLIYMLILHPALFFVSAQIQIVNSNSKLYVVYTLYIIRDAVIGVCMLHDGQLVWSNCVAVGRHGLSCGATVLLWVGTVCLVE